MPDITLHAVRMMRFVHCDVTLCVTRESGGIILWLRLGCYIERSMNNKCRLFVWRLEFVSLVLFNLLVLDQFHINTQHGVSRHSHTHIHTIY